MTPDEIARKVAEILPCRDSFYCELPNCDHTIDCPAHYRPAVETLVREAYEARRFGFIGFDRFDRQHKPTTVLRLLASGQISVGKACRWLNLFIEQGVEEELPALKEIE